MKHSNLWTGSACAAILATVVLACQAPNNNPMEYPGTRKGQVVDSLWETAVEDPYRWLEDDRDPEVVAWASAQQSTTRAFLDALPER